MLADQKLEECLNFAMTYGKLLSYYQIDSHDRLRKLEDTVVSKYP